MKLFLASQLDVSGDKFLEVLESQPSNTRVAFIPTARNFKNKVLEDSTTLQWFREKGFRVDVVDVEKIERTEVVQKLSAADVIFMEGGNSFYLLCKLKESGSFETIKQEVAAGKWYVGSSAGSVVAGPDILYTAPIDDSRAGTTDSSGFGFVTKSVVPHIGDSPYSSPNVGRITDKFGKDFDLLNLTDAQALVVLGSSEKVV